MMSHVLALLYLTVPLAAGYLISPPGNAAPGTTASCSGWVKYSTGMTCGSITNTYGITEAEFESWNPLTTQLGPSCSLLSGFCYCVEVNFDSGSSSSSSSTTTTNMPTTLSTSTTTTKETTTTTTTASNGVATPTPFQAGMTSNCNSFHFVESGDSCTAIVSAAGISLADFYSYNPGIGTSCSSLWLGYYVCTGVIGATTITTKTTTSATTTNPPTTTSAGNGITTPTPIQPNLAANCNDFWLVGSGDSCASISSDTGIKLSEFYVWNPSVGNTCSSLWLGYYVCVGVVGSQPSATATTTTTRTSTTTSAGNGIATPTPYQSGMTTKCNKFWLVGSGDTCATISNDAKVSVQNIEKWNPGVGASCSSLWLGYYICVGILG